MAESKTGMAEPQTGMAEAQTGMARLKPAWMPHNPHGSVQTEFVRLGDDGWMHRQAFNHRQAMLVFGLAMPVSAQPCRFWDQPCRFEIKPAWLAETGMANRSWAARMDPGNR